MKYSTRRFGGCGWVGFSRSPPQNFPFLLALRGYFQNFHTSSQTHITDFFVNCNFQGVLCYLTYRNSWRCTFWSQNQIFKNFIIPQPFLCKKIRSKWSLNRFLQGRALKAPPPTRCPFQRPLLVGLNIWIFVSPKIYFRIF